NQIATRPRPMKNAGSSAAIVLVIGTSGQILESPQASKRRGFQDERRVPPSCGRMTMRHMDIKGAQELAQLLTERNGVVPEAVPVAILKGIWAPPLFHWPASEPPSV